MKNKHFYIAGLAALTLASCKPNLDTDTPSAGPLDLRRYVAVGNSLTAGYADGSLYKSGQENSYPNMLASQFRLVGGGAFKIPYLPGESGWPIALPAYTPKRVLGYAPSCTGVTSLGPVLYLTNIDTNGSSARINAAGPYNNTGVPGIRAIDYLFPGYPSLNPYAKRFYENLAGRPTDEINRLDATFFTAWIGNNDVLGYATSGGAGKGSGGGIADANSISSVPLFSLAVDSVLNRMTQHGAKGAVMNIPDVTAIPFFTTIPPKGLVLRSGQADTLNLVFAGTPLHFSAGANYFVVEDTSVPVIKRRQIGSGEYLLLTLPQDSLKCAGWGSIKPIPARYVLDATEVGNVQSATLTFNQILQTAAQLRGLAYVDMNAYLKTLQTGITFNGAELSTKFVSGGAFSLDGVHLTPKGYALAANEMIRTINAYYKSSIPTIDVNLYTGVKFP